MNCLLFVYTYANINKCVWNIGGVISMLKTIITVLFVLICIALIVIVLLQESKQRGLSGTIGGAADSYWGKNKGRSMEGALETFTKIAAVAFLVLALVLNII